jgi:hypothetical protein
MRYVLQALDAEGYARPLIEADSVAELEVYMCLGFDARVWDRTKQCAVTLIKEAA